MGSRACLDRCGKFTLTGIRSPDLPACSELLTRLSYPGPPSGIVKWLKMNVYTQQNKIFLRSWDLGMTILYFYCLVRKHYF